MNRKPWLFWLSAAWLVASPPDGVCAPGTPPHEKRYFVARYDDYSPFEIATGRVRSIQTERKLFGLFERRGAKLVVGVIPFPPQDPGAPAPHPLASSPRTWLADPANEWVALLRLHAKLGVIEPALHGFEHRRFPESGYRHGEFRLHSFEWQRQAIFAGQTALATALDAPIGVFIPPWNAWDAETMRSLAERGFDWLSADLHHAEMGPDPLRVIPQSTADPAAARRCIEGNCDAPPGSVLVLVIHPFDLEGPHGPDYFSRLDRLLAALAESSEWTSTVFSDLPHEAAPAAQERFRAAVAWHHRQARIADAIGSPADQEQVAVLRPIGWYEQRAPGQKFHAGAVWFSSVLLGVLAGAAAAWLMKGTRLVAAAVAWSAIATTVLLIYGAFAIHNEGYLIRGIRFQAICVAVGFTAAFWTIVRPHRGARPARAAGHLAHPSAQRAGLEMT